MLVICDQCGKEFDKEMAQINKTNGNFCSQSCAGTFNGRKRKGPYNGKQQEYKLARELRQKGYSYSAIAERIELPYNTIRNWTEYTELSPQAIIILKQRKKEARKKISLTELTSRQAIIARLLEIRGCKCETCGISEWQNKPIMVEGHHIDGDNQNHSPKNILLLCPNCHSQTPNYRNRTRD